MAKKILFGGEYSILDPLALFYLSGVARQEGWEPKIVLSKGPEYRGFGRVINEFRPDVFGVSVYTGNHKNIGNFMRKAKNKNKNLTTIVGGPHPTYFPKGCLDYADFVVVGEGFNSLGRILRGIVDPGIVHLTETKSFPLSDREGFYQESPIHGENPIKNMITGTGCFFSCSYCYNSNHIREVLGLTDEQIRDMELAIGSRRFFPARQRPVGDVMKEINYLQRISPSTKMIFLQDDIFGGNLDWLREFSERYRARLPYHANMRFELVNPNKEAGRERIELLKESGCTGLTLAVESGIEAIRREVLNRDTPEKLMFDVFGYLGRKGFKVRTNQMIGLPYGATIEKTPINLEADLKTLELSVRLIEQTGLPTVPWVATLAPYPGTRISEYCSRHGFHDARTEDIEGEETYRIKSVLRHPKKWVGPSLSSERDSWLSKREQERYREQLKALMDYFPVFGLIPAGHLIAKEFLEKGDFGFEDLRKLMEEHNFFGRVPDGEELRRRLDAQADRTSSGVNTTIRHHLYDHDLFVIEKPLIRS